MSRMKTLVGLTLTLALIVLAGCSSTRPAPVVDASRPVPREGAPSVSVVRPAVPAVAETPAATYTVKKGDTLYSIALEHGQDYREVAQWNGLSDPNRIQVGQVLRVLPPDASTAGVPAAGVATVQPVAAPVPVEVRPLGTAGQAAPAATALPMAASANTETMKREPKGGKLPYSEQTLAQVRNEATQPVARPLAAAGERPVGSATEMAPAVAGAASAAAAASAQSVAPASAPAPTPPAAEPDAVDWAWPVAANAGRIVGNFSDGSGGKEVNKGLDLAARPGEPVLAAAAGKVVYAGSGLRGYGQLVIVRHNATWLSAYAHNRKILVKEGQMVTRGERIAEVGNTDTDQFKLHFEIRRQGKPVDPLKYLPPR